MLLNWTLRHAPELFAIGFISLIVMLLVLTGMFISDMLRMLWKS